MSVMNTEGEPMFVDVDSGQQFPNIFSQLITAEEANALAKAGSTGKIEPIDVDLTDTERVPLASDQSTDQCDADNDGKQTKRPFRCQECNRYAFETEEKLIRHLRLHRGENPFQCVMCDYSTYNKAVFEEHVRVHQGIKPFKCSHCEYRSASKKNTKKHELIHREDNPNKCKDCDFIGRNPQSYKHHRETVHPEPTNVKRVCKYCKTTFSTKLKLKSHRRNAKKCPKCPVKYCNAKSYYEHLQEAHNGDGALYTEINTNERKARKQKKEAMLFNCALCSWSSCNKPRILLHLIHHPKQEVDESVIDLTVLRKCGIMP